MSVYADSSKPDHDESTPVGTLDDPATEEIMAHYGALKASCEDVVSAAFGDRALIVRPGLIVGPHDPTATASPTGWRASCVPACWRDRPNAAIVPAPPDRPVQFIDGRDLADWMVDAAAARIKGTFNTSSPPRMWTMGSLVDALVERARATQTGSCRAGSTTRRLWTMASSRGRGCRCGFPTTDAESAGFMEFSSARAIAQGLSFRPLEQTIDDTAAWLDTRDSAERVAQCASAAKERKR